MPACAVAWPSILLGAAILLGCVAGQGGLIAEALLLPRRAVAQPLALTPSEKEQLFRQFEAAPGGASSGTLPPASIPVPSLPAQPTPSRPLRTRPAEASPPAAAMSTTGLRIVVHVPGGAAAEALSARLLANLDPQLGRIEVRRVSEAPSRPSIRYFYSADEAAAQGVAARMSGTGLSWTLRSFSTFRPLPSPGTIEVWLPEGG